MTDSRLFLDSSVWLGYFLGNIPETKAIIDNQESVLFTSIISMHEICKRLGSLGKTEKEIQSSLKFVEENSLIVNLNREIAINAVNNCKKYKLHAIDSLIYSSAMHTDTLFLTADNDFRKLPKAKIIDR